MEQLERVVPELFRLDACKIPFWNKPTKLKEEEERELPNFPFELELHRVLLILILNLISGCILDSTLAGRAPAYRDSFTRLYTTYYQSRAEEPLCIIKM